MSSFRESVLNTIVKKRICIDIEKRLLDMLE
jgi:hypothetical protein